jgi:hypothetical protein
MPIVILILARFGIVSAGFLLRALRIALMAITAAVVTPSGDADHDDLRRGRWCSSICWASPSPDGGATRPDAAAKPVSVPAGWRLLSDACSMPARSPRSTRGGLHAGRRGEGPGLRRRVGRGAGRGAGRCWLRAERRRGRSLGDPLAPSADAPRRARRSGLARPLSSAGASLQRLDATIKAETRGAPTAAGGRCG